VSETLRIAVRVPADDRENAIATLLGVAPNGFEEADAGGDVELVVYGDEAAAVHLRAAFPELS